MTIQVRMHTDLLDSIDQSQPPMRCVHYRAAYALANLKLMREADRDELPDTAMQRFLKAAGACVVGRTFVGAREDREWLREAEAEFGLDWGAFQEAAERAGVDELPFEEAWDLFERWVDSGETLNLYDPDGEDA